MMEIFINELSLESQYHSDMEFREALLVFIGMFDLLREKVREKHFYKDSLFYNRHAIKNEHFLASFNRMNRDVREAFTRIIFNKLNPRDWREDRKHSLVIEYLCPALDFEKVNDTSVAEAAERQLLQPDIEKLLVNFSGSRFGKLQVSSIRVLKQCEPEQSIDVPFIEKKEELKNIFEEIHIPLDIFLHNKDKFRRTQRIVQGRVVFEEIATRHLWYLDNLHRDHYEVFDRDRRHLGEADLHGCLLPGTRDPDKDYSLDK
jgi:hypothetical protein